MIYTIKNDKITLEISPMGAEIKKILFNNVDYLHNSDPKYWGRSAPLLWPNIGAIKNNKSIIDGVSYPMKKHGFLRDEMCEVIEHSTSSITFKATSNQKTLTLYPFEYTILITYYLEDNKILSNLVFKNHSSNMMPFNLGLHPAFKVPLYENENFEDYKIIFGKQGTYEMPVVNLNDGTIDFTSRIRTFTNMQVLPLNYSDYDHDALIFENINTHQICLINPKTRHGVEFTFDDFPMLGIWTPMNIKAPFICLEPWIGCADSPDSSGDFTQKRDIIWLKQNEEKTISYQITLL